MRKRQCQEQRNIPFSLIVPTIEQSWTDSSQGQNVSLYSFYRSLFSPSFPWVRCSFILESPSACLLNPEPTFIIALLGERTISLGAYFTGPLSQELVGREEEKKCSEKEQMGPGPTYKENIFFYQKLKCTL